jgi:polyisoprenoid-binding protein YceI
MLKRLALATLCAAGLTGAAQAEPHTYEIDPSHASIAFLVDHIGYAKTLGQFLKTSGSFVFDEETRELGEVKVVVDATSVFSNDEARDKHIRNSDFLDSGSNPEITFTASGGQATGETSGTVTGDLNIRGVSNPVTLDVTLNKADAYPFGHGQHTLGISARATIKRSEWGMTYALGGLVGDEVDLIIEVEAIRQDN